MDREKEREIELESAMYTNCLLLGLDPAIIGVGASNATPRVGLFRHSNPKLGEQLLYFILSSLRGPIQSAKDFDKVWPIFDSAQSRDFRKVVQGIISELESQGALPRSNSRVSSLATCCGPRFVELLWQLSLHALREVHRRTFTADIASNPLPAPLTDVAFSHAATLLPVTKARIALERRKFLKNAEMAVQRQAMWSNLAHEMTAEFRGLCAEEAYLQQELEKLHDLRNKVKLEGELWDDLVSSSSQNSHLVSKATRLWESLLARKSQHEVLASGPIEDLIAHREHRYRISGSSLLAAMDQSSQAPYSDVLSGQPGDLPAVQMDNKEDNDGAHFSGETLTRLDDRTGRVHQTVDVAEVIRRWTHALQRIHKQSLLLRTWRLPRQHDGMCGCHLHEEGGLRQDQGSSLRQCYSTLVAMAAAIDNNAAKANDGEGPDILRSAQEGGSSGHAESLAATLAEHQQHLASFQVLINQLKDVAPTIQKSISECTEKVNCITSNLPPMNRNHGRSTSPIQAQSSGRMDSSTDDVVELTSRMSNVQLDKVSVSPPTLKLPQLFSLTPSSGKAGNVQRRHGNAPQTSQTENLSDRKSLDPPSNNEVASSEGSDSSYVQNLKRSVREAALSLQSCNSDSSRDSHSDGSSEHFFVPLSETGFSHLDAEKRAASLRSKRLFVSQMDDSLLESHASDGHGESKFDDFPDMLNDLERLSDYDHVNGFLSYAGSNATSDAQRSIFDFEDAQDQVFSPPLLMDSSLLADSFEDLLAPLSETETALIDH
ncbi:HAUS augmin-like complex subunit 6, N-terminal [Sesbania bispinosa]|nr:HAUS augmin-like complex subunit 6, N-terminal [Sesbania bispinosa]